MTFITAAFAIAGLGAVVIPIIIHLLWRQRKRPIEWAAMRFLMEAFRKHKRRLQVEQLLLLITRCLILAVFGLALARPVLQRAGILDSESHRTVVFVVDNGLSAGATDDAGQTALDNHVAQAKAVMANVSANEAVGVITAARPVDPLVMPPTLDHGAVIDLLERLEPAASGADWPQALRLLHDQLEALRAEGRAVVVYLLSDFRAGSALLEAPLPALFEGQGESLSLFASPPATSTLDNLQIVSIDPGRRIVLPGASDGSRQVRVAIERHGVELNQHVSRVRLFGEGLASLEAEEIRWSPGQRRASATFMIELDDSGDRAVGLTAQLDDADALAGDNERFEVVEFRGRIRIAMISPPTFVRVGMLERLTPGQWIRRALSPQEDGVMEIIDVDPGSLDAIDLRAIDVAFLTRPDRLRATGWRALRRFVDRGGLLVITPAAATNVHSWTDHLQDELGLPWRIALETTRHEQGLGMSVDQPASELFSLLTNELGALSRGVISYRVLPVVTAETNAQAVLTFENGDPMMITGVPGEGGERAENDGAAPESEETSARGLVIYLAVSPDLGTSVEEGWTTLPARTLMVPLVQETVRQGLNLVRAAARYLAGEQPSLGGRFTRATDLQSPSDEVIELTASSRAAQPLREPGIYTITDAARQRLGVLAVNPDTAAGRLAVQDSTAITEWLGTSGPWQQFDPDRPWQVLAGVDGGSPLGKILLVLVLALVVLETILARRFSHAYTRQGRSSVDGLPTTQRERRGSLSVAGGNTP